MERTPYPKSGRRGCQCADGTYRIDCCDGNSQGIGGLTGGGSSTIVFVDGSEDVYSVNGLSPLNCTGLILSGFSVSDQGVITLPTTNIGTIASTSPASFTSVTEDTSRTLSVTITVPSGYSNATEDIVCTTTAIQSAPVLPTLSCSDITFTGFAVSYDGVITLPSIDIGTISATSPASFSDPEVDTLRTLSVDVTVPSGYSNAGATLACTTTATQPGSQPTLACSDITFTGLAVDFKGAITTPSVDIGTVASISPTSFSGHVNTDTSRTITINVTVPSGYSNTGATLACSKTVTQSAVKSFWVRYHQDEYGYALGQSLSHSQACSLQTNDTLINIEFIHFGSADVPTMSDEVYIVQGRAGSQTNHCGYGGTGFGSYRIVQGHGTLIGELPIFGEPILCQTGHSPGFLVEPSATLRSADFTITTTTSGVTGYTSCT